MRVIYWNTSSLEPEIEAISKEIFQLSEYFKKSLVVGVSAHYIFRYFFRKRCVGFHPKFDLLLRGLIPLLEQSSDIGHIYGEPCPWIFYKTLRRKPIVLSIASEKGTFQLDFFERCRRIIVQTTTYKKKILSLGLDSKKVELLYPGIDLSYFGPKDQIQVSVPPKLLFATAPRTKEEMDGRGVNLLLAAAKRSPDIHYRFLFRQWRSGYTSLIPTKKLILKHRLDNVVLTNGIVHDMPNMYCSHHFTVIPYTQSDGGKECPNSMVEGFACGRPVLISSVSPMADFVQQHQCGVVFEPESQSLIEAVETGMRYYHDLSKNAVSVAESFFSKKRLLHRTRQIYEEIL